MKNALIIIDMQMGFMNENTEHLNYRIRDFIDEHAFGFDEIIATKYINHKNTACYKFEKYVRCMKGTVDTHLVPRIKPVIDMCIEKDKYSCWSEYLKQHFKIEGIKRVYLCGVNTGCCVLHSAFDMYNDLIECYVIEDLCGSTSGESSHKAAIQILRECITKQRVITTQELAEREHR